MDNKKWINSKSQINSAYHQHNLDHRPRPACSAVDRANWIPPQTHWEEAGLIHYHTIVCWLDHKRDMYTHLWAFKYLCRHFSRNFQYIVSGKSVVYPVFLINTASNDIQTRSEITPIIYTSCIRRPAFYQECLGTNPLVNKTKGDQLIHCHVTCHVILSYCYGYYLFDLA